MKRTVLGLLFLSMAVFAADPAPKPPVTASMAISQLGWLAGNWRLERNGRVVDEQWMAPAGGVMLGMSRTVIPGVR